MTLTSANATTSCVCVCVCVCVQPSLMTRAALFLILAACGGGGGACVFQSAGSATYCHQNYTEQECKTSPIGQGAYSAGKTCADIGYSKQCPNEPGSYRLPSYSC